MLARLQQGITLLWIGLVLAWLAFAWTRRSAPLAAAGVGVLMLLHAAVLAVEFSWMHHLNRADAAPRASPAQVFTAWLRESCHAPLVFCWRQPFRSRRFPDRLGSPGQRGVLLVHGFVCNRGLWNDWLQQLQAGGHPFVAVNLEPVFGSISAYRTVIEDAVQALVASTGRPPLVVAHSMGGLVVRHWWAAPGNTERIHELITLGTPHHGTWLARWGWPQNARQMREGSDWLFALQREEPASHAARTTCYYSHCDNIVFPASNATLVGADNRHLAGVAHVAMAACNEPREALFRRLAG